MFWEDYGVKQFMRVYSDKLLLADYCHFIYL